MAAKDDEGLGKGRSGGFELEDEAPREPAPVREHAPEVADEAAADIEVEAEPIEIEDEAPRAADPEPEDDDGARGAQTIRMSLSDVVSAWEEEVPDAGAATAGGAGQAGARAADRSGIKRMVIAVLVVLAILALIVTVFAN